MKQGKARQGKKGIRSTWLFIVLGVQVFSICDSKWTELRQLGAGAVEQFYFCAFKNFVLDTVSTGTALHCKGMMINCFFPDLL